MSDDKDFTKFVDDQIKRINEYAIWEELFNNKLSNKITKKNRQFNIVDKEWIEKWKEYVGFEEIKDKCKKFSEKENQTLKKEISEFLFKIEAKKKLEELGELDCSKIKRKVKNITLFDEKSNFLPIESLNFNYFKPKEAIQVNGDYIKGKCFLNNIDVLKNENKKIVIFEKNANNNEINEAIITLDKNEDIKKIKEELSKKTLEDMLIEFKCKIEKKEIVKNKEKEKEKNEKEEKEKKEKEEKEKEEKEN